MMAHENGVTRRFAIGNSRATFPKTMAQHVEPCETETTQQQQQQQQQQQKQTTAAKDETVPMQTLTRTCILGCKVNKLALCRFPVHDQKRCNNWLKFFDLDAGCVERLGGLANLRVCLKHFNQKQQMAKTRIKTTPTRLQKDALAATATATAAAALTLTAAAAKEKAKATSAMTKVTTTAATTTTTTGAAAAATASANASPDLKRQHLNGEQTQQSGRRATHAQETLKRTTSVSSATSTLSHTSDTLSNASDTECAPQQTAANDPNGTNGANGANGTAGLLSRLSAAASCKRKVYMITERSSVESVAAHTPTTAQQQSQPQQQSKRKMYLIMEEQNGDAQAMAAAAAALPHKLHTAKTDNKRKKLTLYADQTDAVQLTQKFEQILPEILSRIQATQNGLQLTTTKTTAAMATTRNAAQQMQAAETEVEQQQQQQEQERMATTDALPNADKPKQPITLPPKKNRIKITQADAMQNGQSAALTTTTTTTTTTAAAAAAAAIKATAMKTGGGIRGQNADDASNGHNNANNNSVGDNNTTPTTTTTGAVLTLINRKSQNGQSAASSVSSLSHAHAQARALNNEKQINLSSDFLFLMKMLPKLESIPEPQKQQVKSCIESFINQSASSRCEPY